MALFSLTYNQVQTHQTDYSDHAHPHKALGYYPLTQWDPERSISVQPFLSRDHRTGPPASFTKNDIKLFYSFKATDYFDADEKKDLYFIGVRQAVAKPATIKCR